MSDSIPRGPFDQGLFLSHFNKGRDFYDAHRFDEAERQLEEAYLMRPRDARVLNLLGLVYFRGNKLVKAEEVYRKLVAENPEAPTLHYNLGLICFKLTRLDDAEQAFHKALELTHGNPKIHFYLGSIYERQHRHKDAIYQYREAGAHLMVQRLQGKLDSAEGTSPLGEATPTTPIPAAAGSANVAAAAGAGSRDGPTPSPAARATATTDRIGSPDDTTPPQGSRQPGELARPRGDGDITAPPGVLQPPERPATSPAGSPTEPAAGPEPEPALMGPEKVLQPVSPALLVEEKVPPPRTTTARFRQQADTLPPVAASSAAVSSETSAAAPAASAFADPTTPALGVAMPAAREVFRGVEKGLMEVDFSGKVFIKRGTIYSYTGNLTFWVKEPRPGRRAALVIVTGTGRLLLTDREREITFMQVVEPILVEPSHLLACEESLQPRYVPLADETTPVELVLLEGRGMVALSVASKPLPLTVKPGQPVCVPASSVIMWTGELTAHLVDDPQVYAVVLPSAASGGRLLRLEGSGRILVEQSGG